MSETERILRRLAANNRGDARKARTARMAGLYEGKATAFDHAADILAASEL